MTITLITATIAPFTDTADLDREGTRVLFESLKASGIEYVLTPGTTAEFPALSDVERLDVLRIALDVFGPEGVYAHIGAATARQAIALATQAEAIGAVRLAAITPYFVTAGPVSVVEYYRALAEAVPSARIYVYIFPARATTEVSPATLAELAKIPGVVGAKISGMSTDVVAEYIAAVPAGFEVFSGNDREVIQLAAEGGAGIISGVSTVFPRLFVDVVAAINAGEDATGYQAGIDEAVDAVGGGDIGLLKIGVGLRGLPAGPTRVSLEPPTAEALASLKELLDRTAPLAS